VKIQAAFFTAALIVGTAGAALSDANPTELASLRLPPIQFPARSRECDSTALTDSLEPFVRGGVSQIAGGNAVVFLGLSVRPEAEIRAVIGFFVIDRGKPTYVVMIPGTAEKFILLHPTVGFHNASFGTIDILSNGELKQVDASGMCFQISDQG